MSIFNKVSSLNLKSKVVVTVLILFLGSIWTLTFFISQRLEKDMIAQTEAQQFSTASYIAASIESLIKLRLDSLAIVASEITPELISNPAQLRKFLEQRLVLSTLFRSGLTVTDKQGKGIADYPVAPGRASASFAELEYFKEVIATLKPAVGKPRAGRFSNKSSIVFGAPILDRNGKLMGVVSASTSLSDPSLLGAIETTPAKDFPDRLVLVSRKHHIIITGTDPKRIMTPTTKPGEVPLIDKFMAGFEGSGISVNSSGIRILLTAKQIPTPGWFVRVGLPTEIAFAPIKRMKIGSYSIALGLSMLSSLLLFLVIRQALKPLSEANKLIQDITEKHLPLQKVPVTRNDEIGQLLTSFNMHLDYRKRAEGENRDLMLMLEAVPNSILIHDSDGNFLYANQRTFDLHGYSRDEFMVLNMRHLVTPASEKLRNEMIKELIDHGETSFEVEHLKKDGTNVPLWINVKKAIWGGKSVFLSVQTDLTDRKQAEKEKAKLEDQLRQAQKMESVGRLAGGIAHDFNNMLGVIMGHAEMAIDRADPGQPLLEDLQEIIHATERSADLTRQLLMFARKQVISPKVINLNDKMAEMLKMLHRLIAEDIQQIWMPGTNLWPVKVDPSQINQLLANLCVNARDAIDGVGKITIETANKSFDDDYCAQHEGFVTGDYIMLAVSDNGCGMNKETIDKIYEPFFTTKAMGKGTGLGLSTVYGIVKQNNGFINVYSEPGYGTTFKIYLPRHIGKTEETGVEAEAVPLMRGKETILLVEDDLTLLDLNKFMLERQGYSVLAASTPGEAIRLAKEHIGEIHLLMTDVIMPDMNGRDLANIIFSLKPVLKCLFTSGYTADVIAHHGVLDEGVYFIQKPFSRRDLASKVREVLDQT